MKDEQEQDLVLDADTMRRMGECEKSVAYWATKEVLWNGTKKTVRAPAPMRPCDMTPDGS